MIDDPAGFARVAGKAGKQIRILAATSFGRKP